MTVGGVEGVGGTNTKGVSATSSTGVESASTESAFTESHGLVIAGIASAAAGVIHVAAAAAHSDTTTLAVLFVVLAIAQLESGVAGWCDRTT